MAFSKEIKQEIKNYCNNHLPSDEWYEKEFSFIRDLELRERLIKEFKAIRFAYKLYEGIEASEENLMFEVRNQILAYASIYEAVIEYVLFSYYEDTAEFEELMHYIQLVKISIPTDKLNLLQKALSHDGKVIETFYSEKRKKDNAKVRFDDKCRTAEKLGLIKKFINEEGIEIDLPTEIIEIYSYRNGIHIIAEQKRGLSYELGLSKRAYRRMRPFIDQLKEKLSADGKI